MAQVSVRMEMSEEDAILFQKCVDKLNRTTFIVEKKSPKLYAFVVRENNRLNLANYYRLSGWNLLIDEKVRVITKIPIDNGENKSNAKSGNVFRLSPLEKYLLLALWGEWTNLVGTSEDISITLGDLVDKMKIYNIGMDETKLTKALETFKHYDLIDCDLKNLSEDAPIILYPSLQMGFDIEQFKVIADRFEKAVCGEKEPEDTNETQKNREDEES